MRIAFLTAAAALQQRHQFLQFTGIAQPDARLAVGRDRAHREHIDDLTLIGRLAGCLVRSRIARAQRLVGKHIAIDDAEPIGKQQAADQRQLAQIVEPHDGDAPAAVRQRVGAHLDRIVVRQARGQIGVTADLVTVEHGGVGGRHA